MSALRELLVQFGVEVDDKQLKDFTSGTLNTALDGIKSFGATLAGAFALREMGDFVREQIELGSHLNDTAEKLGVATEELQKFQYAAKLSGVDADSAAHSLQFFNKAMGGVAENNKESVDLFRKLDVAVKTNNGTMRPAMDVMEDLSERFQHMGSQQERTAYAMKLFGREGAALVPVLSQGREGIAKLNEQFDALGGGMSDEFVQAADKAGDTIEIGRAHV